MEVYIDESGNTGTQIFDTSQPFFYALAISHNTNFEKKSSKIMNEIRKRLRCKELHGNDLGLSKIEKVSGELIRIAKDTGLRFNIAFIEKKYIALVRLFDCLFDPVDNLASNWNIYYIEQYRIRFLLEFSLIVNVDILKKFWDDCIQGRNEKLALETFLNVCNELKKNIDKIDNEVNKQVVLNILNWAINTPKEIVFCFKDKRLRLMSSANFLAFTMILPDVCDEAIRRKSIIKKIIHDEQCQFKKVLSDYHELSKNVKFISLPKYFCEKDLNFIPIENCSFEMQSSKDSNGLQMVDICLFLIKKYIEGTKINGNLDKLLKYIRKKGKIQYFTYHSVITRIK